MRTFYTSYVAHAMRFYLKYPDVTDYRSDADKSNWLVSHILFQGESKEVQQILRDFYLGNIGGDWKEVIDFERRWAEKRGLI